MCLVLKGEVGEETVYLDEFCEGGQGSPRIVMTVDRIQLSSIRGGS